MLIHNTASYHNNDDVNITQLMMSLAHADRDLSTVLNTASTCHDLY